MSTTQRWTLAVVSAATAMLMLDIAVVNTALSRIAEDLPAEAALGGGSAVEYVDGFRNAIFAGAGLVGVGAIATAVLLRTKRARPATPGRLAADAA